MTKKSSDGVWGKRKKYKFSLTTAMPVEIEELLTQKFLGGFPVVLSSGRGAIKLIVQEFWTEREISIFQYASQCVVEAIQAAGVTPHSRMNFTSEIIYNQWGQIDLGCRIPPFIEDSCDTFLPEGASVLRLGAQFELWSLPKILNSRFGAVVWCQSNDDAKLLRNIRDSIQRGIVKKQIFRNIRNFSKWNYKVWQILEFNIFQLSKYEYGSIFEDISEWGEKYDERQKLIRRTTILLNEKHSIDLKPRKAREPEIQIHAAPVLLVELNEMSPPPLVIDSKFQFMHKIESGTRPEEIMVYKFLHNGSSE
jgi:putative PLP-dependent aminotransferase (TIGR04422 family)